MSLRYGWGRMPLLRQKKASLFSSSTKAGALECWSMGIENTALLHHSNTPLLHHLVSHLLFLAVQ